MKKNIATAIALLLAATAASSAADVAPRYVKATPPSSVYNWTGLYIGGNLGGGMASAQFDDPCFECAAATPTGGYFTGGAQVGYNYQFGAGLLGIEADVNGNTDFKESDLAGYSSAWKVGIKAGVSGTIRARGGVALNNTLIYVTGGAAWADVDQTGIDVDRYGVPREWTANSSGVVWGGVIGAGVEFALNPNWIVGGEFLHTVYQEHAADIRRADGVSGCGLSVNNCSIRGQLTTDVARVRFSYKFGQ